MCFFFVEISTNNFLQLCENLYIDTYSKFETLKNTEMAERMQNCVTSLDALNTDMKKLDAVFESVESRLSAFVRSENVETVDADRSTLEELLEDLKK